MNHPLHNSQHVSHDATQSVRSTLGISYSTTRGFTLLLAVLISSILLAIGYAIYNIVAKDLILSSSGRESLSAFYAADSGVECALYNDYKRDAFSTSSPKIPVCRGVNVSDYSVTPDGAVYTTTFGVPFGQSMTSTGACVTVRVVRDDQPGSIRSTTVFASGFNTCVAGSSRRTQRSLRVDY